MEHLEDVGRSKVRERRDIWSLLFLIPERGRPQVSPRTGGFWVVLCRFSGPRHLHRPFTSKDDSS